MNKKQMVYQKSKRIQRTAKEKKMFWCILPLRIYKRYSEDLDTLRKTLVSYMSFSDH